MLKRFNICRLDITYQYKSSLCFQIAQQCKYSSSRKSVPQKLKITPKPPDGCTTDLIGPPDTVSNIRPVQFYVPPNETTAEKMFRLRRAEVLEWNQSFWAHHNSKFFKEKDQYIQSHQSKDVDGKPSLSPEELSVFYRSFLNENRVAHLNYNKEWYKKNISMLWPALKVAVIRLRRKFRKSS
ncbi:unnamed protein product [Lymnaea stagnalis]|uniref:Apoptogenic protein 1, mitochondrial n=1 Tax=Lymnaea stagnalis TaxID=6523 RepID=A0AAV2H0D6_LYMST